MDEEAPAGYNDGAGDDDALLDDVIERWFIHTEEGGLAPVLDGLPGPVRRRAEDVIRVITAFRQPDPRDDAAIEESARRVAARLGFPYERRP